MKTTILLLCSTAITFSSFSQIVSFHTRDSFSIEQLDEFYSSFNIKDDLLVVSASDYKLHAYDKSTGEKKWTYDIRYKSDLPPQFVGDGIWATTNEGAVEIDIKTGKRRKALPISSLQTKPLLRNQILYGTGIVDGGCVFAYDLLADTIIWKRFIAHGSSRQPYYLEDRIMANAEGDKWIELNYDGSFFAKGCDDEEVHFPSELPCARSFEALTHDEREISGYLGEAFSGFSFRIPAVAHHRGQTFIFHDGQLTLFGNKLKKQFSIQLEKSTGYDNTYPQQILTVHGNAVWILYSKQLFEFDYVKKKLLRTIDLSVYQPHQVRMEEKRIYVLSGKDGRIWALGRD